MVVAEVVVEVVIMMMVVEVAWGACSLSLRAAGMHTEGMQVLGMSGKGASDSNKNPNDSSMPASGC